MIKIFKRVRKFFEKTTFLQAIVAKTHKKSLKIKFNVRDWKSVSILKLVISKQSSKSKIKDKTFAVSSIEISFDNEKKNDEKKKNDKEKNDNENDENIERINVFLIVKKLFDQKNYKIIDFTKRVNDVKENHVNVLNIQNFEKNKIITLANKKNVNKIFTLITKTYIFAWMIYFENI